MYYKTWVVSVTQVSSGIQIPFDTLPPLMFLLSWVSGPLLPEKRRMVDLPLKHQEELPIFGHPAQNSIPHAVEVSEYRRNLQ